MSCTRLTEINIIFNVAGIASTYAREWSIITIRSQLHEDAKRFPLLVDEVSHSIR